MILKECMLIKNDCYYVHQPATMTGIVVHDTGAGNPNLKRYVQPVPEQSYYDEVIKDLGINTNGNHWNVKNNGRNACVHAFIGYNAEGIIETYQTLPYDICAWGVGSIPYDAFGNEVAQNSKRFHHWGPSYNYNPQARIQFEICDDGYRSGAYFYKVMKEAQEYCAYLCKKFGWNSDRICCHQEAYQQGYGGNHSDILPWLDRFGKNMDWFRNEVQKLIDKEDDDMTEAEVTKIVEKVVEEKSEKVYHYWNEIPSWAEIPLKAIYGKYFVGASSADLNLSKTKMEILVILAGILKDLGKIDY